MSDERVFRSLTHINATEASPAGFFADDAAGRGRAALIDKQRGRTETMAEDLRAMQPDDELPDEPVPFMQQLLDNPWMLLFLGVVVPTVLYTIWGVMEIVSLPVAK